MRINSASRSLSSDLPASMQMLMRAKINLNDTSPEMRATFARANMFDPAEEFA